MIIKTFLLSLLFLLPIVNGTSVEDYVNTIGYLLGTQDTYKRPENYSEFYHSTFFSGGLYGNYDFIILGAGSAGTVLANRLSEIPEWKILVLEAGQNETDFTDVPYLSGYWQYTDFNWGYVTTPQTTCCLGMKNNQCNAPRGKALGGSSVVNYMMYVRGNKEDFDNWAALGNTGWAYDDVLPYFKKSEKSSLKDNVDENYHGQNGTLSVEHVRYFGKLGQAYLDGNEELGRKVLDYNGKEQIGCSRLQTNTINGRRCSGNKAFLNPAIERPNLTVQTGAFITKLIIDHVTKTVLGVEFLVGNQLFKASANKEVILSAGSIGSPQILLHSGIGPKDHLESLGIPVVADLPVGQNLVDHPFLLYPFTTNYTDEELGLNMTTKVEEYLDGFGFLTASGDIQSVGFINTADNKSKDPDVEIFISPYNDVTNNFYKNLFNLRSDVYNNYIPSELKSVAMNYFVLLHPKSRGSVTLKSNNIFDHPLIDFNYFSDPEDVEVLIRALKDFHILIKTEAMQKYNSSILHNPIPGCPQTFLSDDYLRCMIKHLTSTIYHFASTCKMGPETDPGAVVDPKLKVYNVSGLRVIDASIMPLPIAGHTNAPTYMIGEKGADLIKQHWGKI